MVHLLQQISSNNHNIGMYIRAKVHRHTGVIGSDVPWLECPACNALTWVITVTE